MERLRDGVSVGGATLRGRVWRGRFPEESNVEVSICQGGCCGVLFHVKAFRGRPPYYRPWVEVHSVSPRGACGHSMAGPVEDAVISLASMALGPGESLYFEYVWDPATVAELEAGVPPRLSRLGFKLLSHGFTWVKDWYYPEGFMEGAQRLQGEKPAGGEALERHLREALAEAGGLLARLGRGGLPPAALASAGRASALALLAGSLLKV